MAQAWCDSACIKGMLQIHLNLLEFNFIQIYSTLFNGN
jgi:hypothetical protein